MGQYNISVKSDVKLLKITLGGKFTETDAQNFMKDFTSQVKTINPTDYVLAFDSSDLQVSQQEMLPILQNCFTTYKQIGFKKVNVNIGTSSVLKMQVNRVVKTAGLTDFVEFTA